MPYLTEKQLFILVWKYKIAREKNNFWKFYKQLNWVSFLKVQNGILNTQLKPLKFLTAKLTLKKIQNLNTFNLMKY